MSLEYPTEDELQLRYSLAKRVPDIEGTCVIHTNYGPIELFEEDAETVARTVEAVLRRKLKQLRKRGAENG